MLTRVTPRPFSSAALPSSMLSGVDSMENSLPRGRISHRLIVARICSS
jgi:hypothetical protein